MAYEQLKDVAVVEGALNNGTDIVVGVYSYNGGEPKIGLKRQYTNKKGEVRYSAIGRLTLDEAKLVVAALPQLMASPKVTSFVAQK